MDRPAATSGIKFPPPFIYVACFVLGLLVERNFPRDVPIPAVARFAIGGAFLLAGFAIGGWSMLLFFRAGTSPLPMSPTTTLVIAGPYQYTRNPMYVSLLLIYFAVALWFDVFWALVLSPVIVPAVNLLVIRREEKYLEATFGDDYRRYRSDTPRWW